MACPPGSSVVRMMSEFLGADAFQHGLNAYLLRHAYGNAAQDDLWAALTAAARAEATEAESKHREPARGRGRRAGRASTVGGLAQGLAAAPATGLPPGRSVKDIMDSWTLRTGFPIVTVVRDYCSGTATVSQERFLTGVAKNATANPEGESAGEMSEWHPREREGEGESKSCIQ